MKDFFPKHVISSIWYSNHQAAMHRGCEGGGKGRKRPRFYWLLYNYDYYHYNNYNYYYCQGLIACRDFAAGQVIIQVGLLHPCSLNAVSKFDLKQVSEEMMTFLIWIHEGGPTACHCGEGTSCEYPQKVSKILYFWLNNFKVITTPLGLIFVF